MQTGLPVDEWSARGATATVHRVRRGDDDLAIKVAPREMVGLLAAEARILATVASPSLPELVDLGWWDAEARAFHSTATVGRAPCIATRFIEHGPRPSDESAALRAAVDVAAGLADLHAAGFAHGDVKLANVVFGDGQATLVDLGFGGDHDAPSIHAGTARYLGLGDAQLGTAASRDLLALGVVLAELSDPLLCEVDDPVARLRRSPLSGRLGALVDALLARAPAARPRAHDVRAAALELLEVTAGRGEAKRAEATNTVRCAYLRARGALEGVPAEGTASWLAPVAAWHRRIAIFERGQASDEMLAPMGDDVITRWLTALVGPRAAAWPTRLLARAGEAVLAQGLSALAEVQPIITWTFEDVERATSQSPRRAPPRARDFVDLVARVAASPPDPAALDAVRAADDAPPAALHHAARALRLQGDLTRALDVARRVDTTAIPEARALVADLLRRRGDLDGAAQLAVDHPGDADLDAVAARVCLDRGDARAALALVDGRQTARCAEVEALARGAVGDLEGAQAAIDRGLGYASNDEERARLHGALAFLSAARAPARARIASAQAAAFAARAGAFVEEATYLTSAAALAVDEGYFAEALAAAARASLLWDGLDRPEMAARAYLAEAAARAFLGDKGATELAVMRCRDRARLAFDARAACYAALGMVDVLAATGADEAAIDAARWARIAAEYAATSASNADDRLHVAARSLVVGALDPVAIASLDADARADVSAGARLEWWTARAVTSDLSRDVDAILGALVSLASKDAPLAMKGPAMSAGVDLARRAGRADLAARLASEARTAARAIVARNADAPEVDVRRVPWIALHADAGSDDLAQEQVRELEQLVRSLGTGERLAVVLRRVVDALVLWTGVERGLLLLRAPDGRLVPRAARNFAKKDLEGEQRELPRSLALRALEAEEPIVAVDAAGELASVHASVHALKLRSVLAVPLLARGEAIGVVYLDDRVRRGAFGPRELGWVKTIATLAASMIADARDQVLLRRAVRRGARANAALERTLAEREARLDQAERSLVHATGGRGARHAYAAIVGESEPIRALLRLVDRVAAADIPVLVAGESGSGKELVARAIHDHGERRAAPFVSENCGAIPEGLLESVLFGHARGAFTGAHRAHVGLFEAADGGTLFLDEIGELGLGMQTKLLRVLEDGIVRPVGSERSRRVSVRILAATNRDLEKMVAARTFREDLFYRLDIIRVTIPPLRARPGDIPLLVQHLLDKHGGGKRVRVTPAAMHRLVAFGWPGNVRQLENEIRRALVLADGTIDPSHLTPEIGGGQNAAIAEAGLDVKKRIDILETALVTEALGRTRGNQTRAAKLLGLSRFGLQKMVKRLGIPIDPGAPDGVQSEGDAAHSAASTRTRSTRASSPDGDASK